MNKRTTATPGLWVGSELLEARRLLTATPVGVAGPSLYASGTGSISDGTNLYYATYANTSPGTFDIWRSDGTVAGTRRLGSVSGGDDWSAPKDFTLANGKLLFTAHETGSITGYGREVYAVDLATDQMQKLTDASPASSYEGARSLVALGDEAFFVGWSAVTGYELFRTDGTVAGTRLAFEVAPGAANGTFEVSAVNGSLYLGARESDSGFSVYRSNGTAGGTTRLANLLGGAGTAEELMHYDFSPFVTIGNAVLFSFYHGYGDALWRTDGTPAGTTKVANVGGPRITAGDGFAVFATRETAGDGAGAAWVTDGTASGTRPLPGIELADYPGVSMARAGGSVCVPWRDALYRVTATTVEQLATGIEVFNATTVGDRVYFSGFYSGVGAAVGSTDGTYDGTRLLTSGVSRGVGFASVGGDVLYGAGHTLYRLASDAPSLPGVSGHVFRDRDADGVRDPGEEFERNATVGYPLDDNGRFDIRWTKPGTLTLTASSPVEYIVPSTPATRTYTLDYGQRITDADFGFRRTNIVAGIVRVDTNLNDSIDFGEPPAAGQTVYVDLDRDGQADPEEPTQVTGSDGRYRFVDLPLGSVLVSVRPADGWYTTTPVAPGHTLTARVDGSSSIRDFAVSQTPPRNYVGVAPFDDSNRDGVRDVGEPAVVVPLMWLDLDGDGAFDPDEPSRSNASTATFLVPGPGSYQLAFRPPQGWVATVGFPMVTLAAGERRFDVPLATAVPTPSGATLAGVTFNDINGNGQRDANEPGRGNVRVYADRDGDFAWDDAEPAVVTDSLGRFALVDLPPGSYELRQELDSVQAMQTTPAAGEPIRVTLGAGEQRLDLLFGMRQTAPWDRGRISGTVFIDDDVDGIKDPGETYVGATGNPYIDLNNNARQDTGEPSVSPNTQTGAYMMSDLAPGRYRLRFSQGWTPFATSTFDAATGWVLSVTAGNVTNADIGLYRPNARVTSNAFLDDTLPLRLRFGMADVTNPTRVLQGLRITGPGGDVTPTAVRWVQAVLEATFDTALPDGVYMGILAGEAMHGSPGLAKPADHTFRFYVLAGDFNRDRVADFADLGILLNNYNTTGKLFGQGDADYDGAVDFADLGILLNNYNKSLVAPPPAAATPMTSVQDAAATPKKTKPPVTPKGPAAVKGAGLR